MKKHTKIYLEYHGYQIQEDVICEMCGQPAVDIHHIESKGMGGNPKADCIENLVGLCRDCHNKAHAGDITKEVLFELIEANEGHNP